MSEQTLAGRVSRREDILRRLNVECDGLNAEASRIVIGLLDAIDRDEARIAKAEQLAAAVEPYATYERTLQSTSDDLRWLRLALTAYHDSGDAQ